MGGAEVVLGGHGLAQGLEHPAGLVVGDAGEGGLHALQRGGVALQHLEVVAALLQHAPDDLDQEPLGQVHHVVQVGPGHLGLDHPELGEVAAGGGLLGPEGRAEAVGPPEGHGGGLLVELARLGEVGLATEVVRLEQGAGALAGVGREDGRVDQQEALPVEEVADGPHREGPDRQHRVGPAAAQPEVAVLEQEGGAVLLLGDGVALGVLDDLQVGDRQLVAAGGPRVGPHHAAHADRGLLAQLAEPGVALRVEGVGPDDALEDAGAVAQQQEGHLAAGPEVVDPPGQVDLLVDVAADGGDGDPVDAIRGHPRLLVTDRP